MNAYRTVLEADLAPLAGSLFQPTGFPRTWEPPSSSDRPVAGSLESTYLLVESAQSMANWLEGTTWDGAHANQVADLGALPYVRVVSPDGAF